MVLGWKGGDVEGIPGTSWKLVHLLVKGRYESWCSLYDKKWNVGEVRSRRQKFQSRQDFFWSIAT
jgi:hypothetical protein